MNILLVAVNAKYIHSNLAIYSLRAYAKSQGIEVDMAQYTINQTIETMLKDIYRRKPDFIGFSCYIWNIEIIKKLAGQVHNILPKCHIWLGGPEVTFDSNLVLDENPNVEGVMLGEGELTFVKVINTIRNNDDEVTCQKQLTKIEGVAFSSPRVINPQTKYIDMNVIPFPYEGFDDLEHRIIYYESSRGCPYSCSYCLSSVDKRVRYRDLELVKRELMVFINAKVPQVKFVDRTFNCNRDRTKQIWEFINDNDNGITNFHFEVSADIINDEEIELLSKMRPGLVQLEIGVQTTNMCTIEAIHRSMNLDKLNNVVARINQSGNVHQHLDLIAGLPYEDYSSFKKSFNDVYKMKPQQLQLGFLKVLKGSFMHENAKEYEIVYTSYPPYEVIKTQWLTYDDVLKLKGVEEMVENYYNSGQFVAALSLIERFFDTPFDMFEYLAQFYEEKEYADIGHSRIRRYDILREAIAEFEGLDDEVLHMLDEAMTYDIYARENIKSRPDFAGDNNEYRNLIHSFYTSDSVRELLPEYYEYSTKQIERMTDVEFFNIDVLELCKTGQIKKEQQVLLFDYKKISKITGQAQIVDITKKVLD